MDRRDESSQFKLTDKTHTTFYNRFFTLRVHVSVNGQTTEIGVSDKNILRLSSRYPEASISFDSLVGLMDEVVRRHGVSGVSHSWCENEAPLFELTIKPGDDLSKLLHTADQLQTKLAVKMEAMFLKSSATPLPSLAVNVHTELYMMTPNAANSSVHLVAITDDNLLVCLDLWRDSAVFNFGAAFTAYRTEPILDGDEGFEPGLINKELSNVVEWYSLGSNLGLSKDDLDTIRQDVGRDGSMQCRLAILTLWYDRCADVSWPELISALVLTGRRRLAHKLALKYRVAVPPTLVKAPPIPVRSASTNEPSSPTPVQEELYGKVKELRRSLEEKDTELEDKEREIKESNSRKQAVTNERDLVALKLKLNIEKNAELQMEKKSLEQELQSQGVELKLLESVRHDSKWQGEVGHLQEMIEEKKERIKELKDRLKSVEADLQSERVLSRDLKDKVSLLEREVREKTAEVHSHEMEVIKMKYELKDQRSELDQLNQLRAANSTQKELLQEFEHQLFVVKQESEAKGSEIELYKFEVSEKKVEMQKLMEKLQEQLASQQQLSSRLQKEREREVMAEILELQARLSQAEQDKRRAEGELAASQLHITKLKEREEELRRLQLVTEKKKPPPVKPRTRSTKGTEELSSQKPPLIKPRTRVSPSSESTPDPQKCTAVFPYSQLTTGTAAQFEVHFKNAQDEPCLHKHDINITAQLTSLVDSSTTNATVVSHTQAISTLSYESSQRGRHHLNVSVNGEPIANSPFLLYVQHAPEQLGQLVRVIGAPEYRYRVAITSDEQLVVTGKESILVFDKCGKLRSDKSFRLAELVDYKIDDIQGIAVDDNGVMYISDGSTHKVFKVSSDHKLLKAVGGCGSASGQFNDPDGITLFGHRVFVCDFTNDRVKIYDTDLNLLHCFGSNGSGEGEFSGPVDIASDQDGCLYVADHGNDRVEVFSPGGSYLRSFGRPGHGPGEFDDPSGIHLHNDYVYITDCGNDRVSVFTKSGLFVSSFDMKDPQGIVVDKDGYLYVCDYDSPGHVYVY